MEGIITPLLIEPPPIHWQELLSSILHFAYYHLSVSGVGATLIWCIHDRVLEKHKQDITGEKDFRWAHLNMMRREDMPALVHLLAQKDLATLIDSAGNVVAVGVHLKPRQEAPLFIQKLAGSDPASAEWLDAQRPFLQHFAEAILERASRGAERGALPTTTSQHVAECVEEIGWRYFDTEREAAQWAQQHNALLSKLAEWVLRR